MRKVLCIETVFQRYRLLILEYGSSSQLTIGHVESTTDSSISSLLYGFTESLSLDFKQLGGIYVVSGPGSYTGIRIGYSLGMGLSFALGIPISSINTHELIKESIQSFDDIPILTLLEARHGELFYGLFDSSIMPQFGHSQIDNFERFNISSSSLRVVSNSETLLKAIDWRVDDEINFVENVSHETLSNAVRSHYHRHGLNLSKLEDPFYQKDVYIKMQ